MQTHRNKIFLWILLLLIFIPTGSKAAEYQLPSAPKTIHTVTIISDSCSNISLSTKVGHYPSEGSQCEYTQETAAHGFDSCGPFYLNGGILEDEVGEGYTCAATHAHSNVTGADGLDEFKLLSDSEGHYVDTEPSSGSIHLENSVRHSCNHLNLN